MGIEQELEKQVKRIDTIIEKYLPKKIDKSWLEKAFGKARFEYDSTAINRALAQPIWDFLDRGGKRWRPALFLITVEAMGKNPKKLEDWVALIELAHEGSIMVDDVEDSGLTRRGKPCTHITFGTDVAINAGNFMYFLPLLVFRRIKLDSKTALSAWNIWSEEMTAIHLGQGLDIWWHKGKSVPTENEYLQMCALKTGTLARMAARLGVALSGGSEKQEKTLGKFAETIGVAFQIQDDILDIVARDRKKFGKAFGNDITEGKRTLMVIHALKNARGSERQGLLKILDAHTRDPKLIKEAINIIKKHGSIEYAGLVAKKLVKQAWAEASRALPESAAKKKLKSFADFLIERKW